jgi:TRAP-type C4-dicarboxylate transport system substrate-binding protein
MVRKGGEPAKRPNHLQTGMYFINGPSEVNHFFRRREKMKKLMVLSSVLGILLVFVLGVYATIMAAELPKVTWKLQLCCPDMSPAFKERVGIKQYPESEKTCCGSSNSRELARLIGAKTNGRFKIRVFAAGELFSVPQAYEALEKGAIDMWFGPPWAFSGRNPIGYVAGSLPFSINSHDQAYDIMYETNAREILRRAYARNNIYYITGAMGGADGITSTFPIHGLADFKGKKIRGGGIKGKVLSALGAVDVKIAPGEIYTALQRGVVDGACMPTFVFGEWGFFEITKYVSLPPVFSNWWVDYAANMDSWNKLPKEYQRLLQEEADAQWKWTLKTLLPHIEKSVHD